MPISLKHAFVSAKTDGDDSTQVQPSNWNEEHELTLGAGVLVGRYAATDGAAQEITPSTGLSLDTGTGALTVNLSSFIGSTVQAWDADLDTWAGKTAPSGTVVGTSDTQTLTNKTITSAAFSGTQTGTFTTTGKIASSSAGEFGGDLTAVGNTYLNATSSTTTSIYPLEVGRLGGTFTLPALSASTVAVFHPGGGTTGSGGLINMVGGTASVVGVVFGDSDADQRGGIVYSNSTDTLALSANGSTFLSSTGAATTLTGGLTTTGDITIANGAGGNGLLSIPAVSTETSSISVGGGRSGNGFAYIDFVGDATYSAYGLRLIRSNTGANTSSQLIHRGTGGLLFICDEASTITFQTDSTARMTIGSTGIVDVVGAFTAGTMTADTSVAVASGPTISAYGSGDTDITGVVIGSTIGGLIEGPSGGHMVVGIRGNDGNDSFSVISGGGNWTTDSTYDTLCMALKSDGKCDIPGVYAETDPGAANMFVATDGSVRRSTSSLRYKVNVEDMTYGLKDVLALRPVTYAPKPNGDNEAELGTRYGGLIAEEVHAAGLTEFVGYNEAGEPDSLHYGHMVALCVAAIKDLKAEIEQLKEQING